MSSLRAPRLPRLAGTLAVAGALFALAVTPAAGRQPVATAGPIPAFGAHGLPATIAAVPGPPRLSATGARAAQQPYAFIRLKGSRRHEIVVEGNPLAPGVEVRKKRRQAAYYPTTYKVAGRVLRFQLGQFGKVDVKFKPRGKARKRLPRGCKGTPNRIRRGIWKGTIRFRGEGGYTRVKVRRAKGTLTKPGSYKCPEGPQPPTDVALLASRGDSTESVDFFATRPLDRPNARPRFGGLHHAQIGKVNVFHFISARGEPGDFTFSFGPDEGSHTASVTPPSPFKGSATLEGGAFLGDLRGRFLDGPLALAGPDFDGDLFETTIQ